MFGTSLSPNPNPITFGDTAAIDAFNRLRVSNPFTVFDSKQIFDNQPLFWDDQQVSGSGTTSSHSVNAARTRMSVTAATAGKRVRQTFMRFNYQPGKSQMVFMTCAGSGMGTGINAEVGQCDDNNGVFVTSRSGVMYVGKRSYVTGSVVETLVAQSSWNIDTMDGNGPSGITLDFDTTQIIVIDYEWLGVGRVRMGFAVDGLVYYVHEFLHANNQSTVYMSSPNLPLRYSIENTGAGGAGYLDHICATVITEGGQQDLGVLRHTDNGGVAGLASGTTYAMIGVRLKSTHLGAAIDVINASLLSTTSNDVAHWELRLNPTVAGTFTYGDVTNSSIQTALGAITNTITGGYEIDGGYFSSTQGVTPHVVNAIRLGASIAGTRDEIVLCVRPITNNITVHASMTWRELS